MSLKSERGNFEGLADRRKFMTMISYFTTHPMEAIESEGYFLNAQGFLEVADEIYVSAIRRDGTWDKALFEVIVSREKRVETVRLGNWRHGGAPIIAQVATPDETPHASVPEDCEIRHKGNGRYSVIGMKSHREYAAGLDKDTAIAVARGDVPIPKPTGSVIPSTPAPPAAA